MYRTRDEVDRDIARQSKTCTGCGELKPFNEFWVHSKSRDGRQNACIKCRKGAPAYSPEKLRRYRLQRVYGITTEQYDELLVRQDGVCAICKAGVSDALGRRLSVDHDHETGRVRGLLCTLCNRGIGYFKDDANLIRLAAEYLEK